MGAGAQKGILKTTGSYHKHWLGPAAVPNFAISWSCKPSWGSSYKRCTPVMVKLPSCSNGCCRLVLSLLEERCFPIRMMAPPRKEWPFWGVYTNLSLRRELWCVHRWASRQKKAPLRKVKVDKLSESLNKWKFSKVKQMPVVLVDMVVVRFTCVQWCLRSWETGLDLIINSLCWPVL